MNTAYPRYRPAIDALKIRILITREYKRKGIRKLKGRQTGEVDLRSILIRLTLR
jgi:hypothetical protein